MKTSFFVPIEAAPKGSKVAFHTGNGKIAMRESSKQVKPFMEAFGRVAIAEGLTPVRGPICLDVVFVRKAKKNMPKTYIPFVTTLPDVDKQLRSVLDALTGIAYYDDGQVVMARGCKVYPSEYFPYPGTHITITAGRDVPEWLGQYSANKKPNF